MSEEHNTIHEFDFNLIREYFSHVERQGPGCPEVTKKALSFVDNLSSKSKIADIGCGTGGQTMVLGQNTSGQITGLDIFQEFIDTFNQNTRKLNLQDRVKGMVGSMFELPFQKEEFDLIWCEGAIYFLGFEKGLKEFSQFLKAGGYIAVTDASWFTEERPDEIHNFWMDAYPGIDTISNNVQKMQNSGFLPVASFVLPEYCWIGNHYKPLEKVNEVFLKKYAGNEKAEAFVKYQQHEAQLYYKYKEFYGYVFYIGKKLM